MTGADDHGDGHGDEHGHGDGHGDEHDDHGHEDRPEYDPHDKSLPSGEPALRSTAPQSDYTSRDVGVGIVIMLVGVALTFGLPLALA